MTRLAALPLTAAIALSACAATSQQPPLRDAANVALGQKAYVDGPIVRPVEVIEDSRCPANAECVWAGRVRVKMVWIRGNGERQPFEAVLGEPVQLADGQFTLASVWPEKRSDDAIKSADYRFSFRFAGGL